MDGLITVLSLSGVVLNAELVLGADNLQVEGNTVIGETFNLVCSIIPTSTGGTLAKFYRGTTSGVVGPQVAGLVYTGTACEDRTPDGSTSYAYGCRDNGKTFYLTIPADNEGQHNTYWRCSTNTDPTSLDNNEVHISIIVPVTAITLISPAVESGNIISVRENVSTTFQCRTSLGRPSASISWYLNNDLQTGGTTSSVASGDKVQTTGTLSLPVDRTAQDKTINCTASNYDNMTPVQLLSKPTLNVKYPPSGPPTVDSYTTGSDYKTILGTDESSTCRVPVANPQPALSWSCPSYSGSGTSSSSTGFIISTTTWKTTTTVSEQTCRCISSQDVLSQTAIMTLDVLYPPVFPTYRYKNTDVSGSGSIDVIQGDDVQITCNTDSNPLPASNQYRWSKSPDSTAIAQQQVLTLSNIAVSSEGTYQCEVTNTMTPTVGDARTRTNSSQISIMVLYPPTSPTFKYRTLAVSGSIDVIQGDDVQITCNTDSNPLPDSSQYRWSKSPGSITMPQQQVLTLSNIAVSSEGTYQCEVTNTMTPTVGGSQSKKNTSAININILYPPAVPTLVYNYKTQKLPLTAGSSISVIRGNTYNVSCQSVGRPDPTLRWTLGSQTVSDTSILPIRVIQMSSEYTCLASNVMVRDPGDTVSRSSSASISVDVQYPPSVSDLSPQEVTEGSALNVTCQASSNPSSRYHWSRPVSSSGSDITGAILHIPVILRGDAGTYMCHAENIMMPTGETGGQPGSDNKTMAVAVRYFPTISGTNKSATENDKNVGLTYTAEGFPATYSFSSLEHIAPDKKTVLRAVEGIQNGADFTTTFSSVSYEDSGYYKCSVSNGVTYYLTGESVSLTTASLFIKNRPVVTYHRRIVDAEKEGNKTILVEFYSNTGTQLQVQWNQIVNGERRNITDPRFAWSTNSTQVNLTMYGKTVIQPGFVTILSVTDIQIGDFGDYVVELENEVNKTTVEVTLRPQGPPDPPYNVTSTSTTDSITVYWRPGFHGGAEQTFIVTLLNKDLTLKDSAYVFGGKQEDTTFNATFTGLTSGSEYFININASNEFGVTLGPSSINAKTMKVAEEHDRSQNLTGPAVGGAVGAVAVIAAIVIAVVIFKRRQPGKSKSGLELNDRRTLEEAEEDIVINDLYAGGPVGINNPAPSAGASGNDSTYAQVVKPKKKQPNPDNNLYAVVDKSRKLGAGNPGHNTTDLYATPVKKGKGKGAPKKNKKKGNDNTGSPQEDAGTVYENAGPAGLGKTGADENVYENPKENDQQAAKPQQKRNKDGLLYADLEFVPTKKGEKKLVIHGLENTTEYAEVVIGKRGEPLPDSDDETTKVPSSKEGGTPT